MRVVGALVIAIVTLVAARDADAGRACIPQNLEAQVGTPLRLGSIAGVPVVCAIRGFSTVGCWDIDLKSGKLAARAVNAPPGRSAAVPLDAKNCVDGYCVSTQTERTLMATSTDGQHVVIGPWGDGLLSVFDATTKKLIQSFSYSGDTDDTIIGNAVVGLLYIGNMIYLHTSDAGPYQSVFAIRDDGTRFGQIGDGTAHFSINEGSASVLDTDHLAITDPFFQKLVIIAAKDNSRRILKRPFAFGPCSDADLDVEPPVAKCKKHFAKTFAPYAGAEVIALPKGDLLVALTSAPLGQLAILDGKKLVEKRRLRLPTCR